MIEERFLNANPVSCNFTAFDVLHSSVQFSSSIAVSNFCVAVVQVDRVDSDDGYVVYGFVFPKASFVT